MNNGTPVQAAQAIAHAAQDAEVLAFATQAAASTAQVPLATVQATLDRMDERLGQACALAPNDRPAGHEELARDVRRVRALLRYRTALEGIG